VKEVNAINKEVSMSKNFALLSISVALFISLVSVGVGQAVQTDWKKQARTKVAINAQPTQVSNTASPCGGRHAAACKKHSQSEAMAR
jgi:hypothetical protein